MEYSGSKFIHLKKRGVAAAIILTFLTCGIYGIFWMIWINNELRRETNQNTDGLLMFLFSLITCGLFGLYWVYRMGNDLAKISERSTQTKVDSSEPVMYIILTFFGLAIIAFAIMQHKENLLCDEKQA